MATKKQIRANQTNGRASTGPKTDVGKHIVSQNALKLGIYSLRPVIPGLENAEDWDEFRAGIVGDLAPVGAFEVILAERVAGCLWRLRRVTEAEAAAIDSNREDYYEDLLTSGQDIGKVLLAQAASYEDALAKAENVRERLDRWANAMSFFAKLDLVPDAEPVDVNELFGCVRLLAEELGNVMLCVNDEFLDAILPPAEPKEKDPWERTGWTIAHVRRAIGELELYCDQPFADFMEDTYDELRKALPVAEAEAKELLAKLRQRRQRMLAIRSIPDDNSVAKIARYESHLTRQMSQALHELERRQASRKGGNVAPPRMVDVNIYDAETLPINGIAKQSQFEIPIKGYEKRIQ